MAKEKKPRLVERPDIRTIRLISPAEFSLFNCGWVAPASLYEADEGKKQYPVKRRLSMKRILLAFVLTLACAHGESTGPTPTEVEGPPGSFDVECRFGISGCERKAANRCGAQTYKVLSTYQTSGAAGTAYWYMKAICVPR